MAAEGLQLKATAKVKLSKYNDAGELIGVEEHEIDLTDKEAKAIWDLQQQA